MEPAMSFFTNTAHSVSTSCVALWNDVLSPFGAAFVAWVQGYLPFCGKFADFCFNLFKLRYSVRVYSFMLIVPLALIALLLMIVRSFFRRRRRAKLRRRFNK